MQQVLQSLSNGSTEVVQAPCPRVGSASLLIATTTSLISAGTERMLVDFGKAGLIGKARRQPDKVRQVLDKAKTDGLLTTMDAVRHKMDEPMPLGYCNVGRVLETGADVPGFEPGDRVVSNGAHAECVSVPKNLCCRIPDGVSDEHATFAVLGAIGLQGVRLAAPTLGETFVVSGLGLVGLLTVQMLRANGCRVLGMDFDPDRLRLAASFGAEVVDLRSQDPLEVADAFSRGRGVDGVLIAAATDSNDPVQHAAKMCRKRGRIVLVGVAGLQLSRQDFFEKEITFQVSCSYGPGRYDAAYEEAGHDYPEGFVRWTAQRNFEAVLDMMDGGQLDVDPLISHRFELSDAPQAYQLISDKKPSIGVLLTYPQSQASNLRNATVRVHADTAEADDSARQGGTAPRVAFLGAGNFARQVLIPAFAATNARLDLVNARGGLSALLAAKKNQIAEATSDTNRIWQDQTIDTVAITTRHDSHAGFVCEALRRGKHVFVEKPLAIGADELAEVVRTYQAIAAPQRPVLTVGFNRRFSPHVTKMKQLLQTTQQPLSMVFTVNAGVLPPDHWLCDPQVGGGRIIGEACHFLDTLRFLCGHPVVDVQVQSLAPGGRRDEGCSNINLTYADGSTGTVHYLSNGHKRFAKERLEVFVGGRVLQLDNFRVLQGFGFNKFRRMRLWRQDKGHQAEVAAFVTAIESGGELPIPFAELEETSRVAIDIASQIRGVPFESRKNLAA